jgi:hypothetical protein
MRKFTKICLWICLVLACLAALCFGAGLAMGSGPREVWKMVENDELTIHDWNFGRQYVIRTSEEEDAGQQEKTIDSFPAEDILALDVELKYGELEFLESDSGEFEISVDAPAGFSYVCKQEKETLVFKDTSKGKRWNTVHVAVSIPAGTILEKAEITTNAGTVDAGSGLSAEKLDFEIDAGKLMAKHITASEELEIEVGAGQAELSDFTAGELNAECGMGEIDLQGTAEGDVSAECGMGQITLELSGSESDYNYEISCGVGDVTVNGREYSGLSHEVSLDNGAEKEVSLDCGIGEICVQIQ